VSASVGRMRRAWLLVPLLAVAGCGGGSSKTTSTPAKAPANDPVSVAQAYVDALGSGDYATDCTLISKATAAQASEGGKTTCEKHFATVMKSVGSSAADFFKGAKVGAAKVKGSDATVVVTSTKGKRNQLTLVREGGRWRVQS
jgi:hypothetical protein